MTSRGGECERLLIAGERLSGEIERRKQAEQSLRERLLFEELLSAISARFINLSSERIDAEIHNAMQAVLNFFKVDRFALLRSISGQEIMDYHPFCVRCWRAFCSGW